MADNTNISNISTYTADDQQAIYDAYALDTDADGKVDAAFDADGDGKVDAGMAVLTQIGDAISTGTSPEGVAYEDLVSFFIDQTGDLPPAGIPGPDQLGTDAWADDGALVETLNQWRVEALDTDLATALETLITTNTTLDISTVADTEEFISDYYSGLEAADATGGEGSLDDMTNLVTNMVTICMNFGNPGMALLAYVIGFDANTREADDDDDEDVDDSSTALMSTANIDTLEVAGELGAVVSNQQNLSLAVDEDDLVAVSYAETAEDSSDGPMGTADSNEGEIIDTIEYKGLGDVVRGVQEEAIEVISDSGETLDDLIDDMRDIDPEDSEAQADMQEIQTQIDNVKTVMSTMTEFIKNSQDILDNIIEAAAALNEKQSRTASSIINKI